MVMITIITIIIVMIYIYIYISDGALNTFQTEGSAVGQFVRLTNCYY